MADIQREPVLQVFIDGRLLPNVTGARVTRGFDQKDGAQAQITLSGNAPAWVKQGSQVAIRMGGTIATAYQRLFGYVGPFGSNWSPASDTLDCGDALFMAKFFKPSADILLDGKTDQEIITLVFQTMGVPDALLEGIGGTGKVFSDDPATALVWPRNMTAGSVIEEVDTASLGWTTWVATGGEVKRTQIIELPTATAAYVFTEGIDIISGTSSYELPEPNNEVTVLGDGAESTVDDAGANTVAWHTNPLTLEMPMLVLQATSPTQLSTEEVAEWQLEHFNRNLVTVNFATHRDDPLSPDMTISTDAPHLRVQALFWLQNVVTEISGPQFRQQVQLVSTRELMPDLADLDPGAVGAVNPFTGAVLPLPPAPTLAPGSGVGAADVLVSFSLAPIDKELVIVGGVDTTIYTVSATDATAPISGTVATRAWTAAGPGVVIASGDQETLVTGFTSLTGASLTLVVTDSLGNTGTATRALDGGGGAPIKVMKIRAATSALWKVFDGGQWRSDAPGGLMLAIAPGPHASAALKALRTTDDLATAATSTTPFTSSTVAAIWSEEDVNTTDVVAGATDGRAAISSDGGQTWTLKAGPGGDVRRIILSRFVTGQVHVICGAPSAGYYTGDGFGDVWTLQRLGDFEDLILSHSRNVVVTAAGGLERAEAPGDAFTFPGSPTIVSAAPNVLSDDFYAFADDGTTYATDAPGSFAMEAREPVPAGIPAIRGADNGGEIPGMVLVATDANLYKSLDGLRTPDGYLLLQSGAHILVKHGILTDAPGSTSSGYVLLLSDAVKLYGIDAAGVGTEITASGFTGGPVQLDCPAGQSSVVYASWGPTNFARSDDGGLTWTSLTVPGSYLQPIAAGSATVAYAITDPGSGVETLYKSTDSGGSWASIDAPTGFRDGFGQQLWANATGAWWPNGTYDAAPGFATVKFTTGRRTTAAGSGAQFNAAPDTSLSNDISTLAPAQDGSDAALVINENPSPANDLLYRLAGTTVTDVTPPAGIGHPTLASYGASYMLAVMSSSPNSEIWRSTDSGATWTRVAGPTSALILNIGINASDPTKAYATVLGGTLLVSGDSGVTWTPQTVAAFGGGSYGIMAVLG